MIYRIINDYIVWMLHNLEEKFESTHSFKFIGALLVGIFIAGIILIELNRQNILPSSMADKLPTNHLIAIDMVFNLLLFIEVISLIFKMVRSFSDSVGKQFEVFSLILLRDTFKEFSHFQEPLCWSNVAPAIIPILATSGGSLVIFVLIGFYYKLQKHKPISRDENNISSFKAAKYTIALLLLGVIQFLGVLSLYQQIAYGKAYFSVFGAFYTVLVFADIFIVIFSIRGNYSYPVAFRNSGFAVSTIIIRLALIAPPAYGAGIGIGAAVFAISLTLAYNYFTSEESVIEFLIDREKRKVIARNHLKKNQI